MGEPKVTLKKPSEEAIEKAAAEVTVTDARGRVFTLRKPGVLAQFRLVEALGDTAKNQTYMGMVLPVIFVAAIDGEPVMTPSSKLQVEALIQRLDEDGLSVIGAAVASNFGNSDPDADRATLKK
jgi:hypothetical protein